MIKSAARTLLFVKFLKPWKADKIKVVEVKQRITMKKIAEELHVSVNAVSLAVNGKNGVGKETRNRILNKAEEMGYFDAKPQYGKAFANKNICLIIQAKYFQNSDFYSAIVLGLESEAKRKGYEVLVNFPDKFKDIPDCLIQGRVCGIISVGKISDDYLHELKQFRIPLVVIDHMSLAVPSECILSNNKQGSYAVTRLLIQNGYRKIGFFGDLNYSMSIKERFAGYREAIYTLPFFAGYSDTVQYILKFSALQDIEKSVIQHDLDKLADTVRKVHEMPEAFVCSNDDAAVLLMHALQKLNYRIPKDIAVVGFDNTALSTAVLPRLTTVNVHKEELGKEAVDRILWRLNHPDEPMKNTVLNVEVVERDSVKKDSGKKD